MQALWRLALWGGFAAVALFVAVIATFSGASLHSATSAPPLRNAGPDFGPQLEETAEETRRLTEAVHALSADRDQLLARVAVLERNVDSTGSIRRDRAPGGPPAAPQPAAAQAPPPGSPQAPPQTVSQAPPAISTQAPSAPLPPAAATAAGPIAAARPDPAGVPPWETAALAPSSPAQSGASEIAKTSAKASAPDAIAIASAPDPARARGDQPGTSGLGVDVGSAANYDGLRALWHSTKNNDPGLLEGLFPVVAARENGKTHGAELRLILGPMADVESAARLCADLQAAHQYCQPVAFEGQPLSLNESAPASKTAAHHRVAAPPPPIPSVIKSAPEPSPYAKLTK
jgi:hypothetical protein